MIPGAPSPNTNSIQHLRNELNKAKRGEAHWRQAAEHWEREAQNAKRQLARHQVKAWTDTVDGTQ